MTDVDDLTPILRAAAFHGLATNPNVPPRDRLALALQALDLLEAELEQRIDLSTVVGYVVEGRTYAPEDVQIIRVDHDS